MVSYDIPKGNETTKPWQIRENGTDKKFIAQPKINPQARFVRKVDSIIHLSNKRRLRVNFRLRY